MTLCKAWPCQVAEAQGPRSPWLPLQVEEKQAPLLCLPLYFQYTMLKEGFHLLNVSLNAMPCCHSAIIHV